MRRIILTFLIVYAFNSVVCMAEDNDSSIFDFLFGDDSSDQEKQNSEHKRSDFWNIQENDEAELYSSTHSGAFLPSAKIRVLDINTGKSQNYSISTNHKRSIGDFSIQVFSCWLEEKYKLHPENISLIALYRAQDAAPEESVFGDDAGPVEDLLFYGWIFTNHKSLAQPRYKNYYIQLDRCE